MRLWSLHPRHLDAKGLVALWREGLLARKVLHGGTRGYTRHPQLDRFRAHAQPQAAIDAYLSAVCDEADARGYAFARDKLGPLQAVDPIAVNSGQIEYEWRHLLAKLGQRSPVLFERWSGTGSPDCHPLFRPRPGSVEPWERP